MYFFADQPSGKLKPKEKKVDKKKHKSNVSEKSTKSEEEIKTPSDNIKPVTAKRDKPVEKVLKETSKKEAAEGNAPQTQSELTTEINIIENTGTL